MAAFKRGLSAEFVRALMSIAESEQSWWRDVLEDTDLIIAVRNQYLNVYWQGQSIFKIDYHGQRVIARAHPKYLLNPDLSKLVSLDPEAGTFERLPENAILKHYKGSASLNNMKKAAALFSGAEKRGVHSIAIGNPNVIDVEVEINAEKIKMERMLPRIDIAAFAQMGGAVELVFWEAKLFTNKEIRSKGNVPRVVDQIEEYRTVVNKYREDILAAYLVVASNMVSIAEMSRGKRTVGQAICAVASGKATINEVTNCKVPFQNTQVEDCPRYLFVVIVEELVNSHSSF